VGFTSKNINRTRKEIAIQLAVDAEPGCPDSSRSGPVTALATEVFLGDSQRFAGGQALASYVGMIPREYFSGGRQKLGGLSKQGNPLLRFPLG
jgi:transposase